MKLENKTIIVTGAGRGIGRAIALQLAAEGAELILISRTEVELNETLRLVSSYSSSSSCFPLDISDYNAVSAVFENILKKYGKIDCLVNNAGVQPPIGSFSTINLNEWKRNVEINLFGTVTCAYAVVNDMIRRKKGKIVNLSGGGATAPRPNFSAYAIAKVGVVRFAETLAAELAEYHIDVNAVAPGAVSTKMLEDILSAHDKAGKEYQDALERKESGGMDPRMAAELVCFLCSDESNGITGKLISAPWDPWQTKEFQDVLKSHKDFATLRRIDNKTFFEKL